MKARPKALRRKLTPVERQQRTERRALKMARWNARKVVAAFTTPAWPPPPTRATGAALDALARQYGTFRHPAEPDDNLRGRLLRLMVGR